MVSGDAVGAAGQEKPARGPRRKQITAADFTPAYPGS